MKYGVFSTNLASDVLKISLLTKAKIFAAMTHRQGRYLFDKRHIEQGGKWSVERLNSANAL